jgi:hypothetical protein
MKGYVFSIYKNRTPMTLTKAFFAVCCFLFSTAVFAQQKIDRQTYIAMYKDIAIREMKRAGIPASIKLAQALLESDGGNSYLATTANNHFGIKCGSSWKGKKAYREDDDFDANGDLIASCFRAYKDAEESFIAHTEFLRDPRKDYRYGFLFKLDPTDYKTWATGLKKSGYATSPTYDKKLIRIIETYGLDQYDQMEDDPKIMTDFEEDLTSIKEILGIRMINDVELILADEGDTPAKIASRTGTSLKKILKYNEQIGQAGTRLKEGTYVYLDKKRNFFRGNKKWHYVKEDEGMYEVAQLYGIKLEKLYKRNLMPEGSQPAAGERIRLKGRIRKETERPKLRSEMDETPTEEKETPVDIADISWPPEDPFADPDETGRPNGNDSNPEPPSGNNDELPTSVVHITHVVQKGDTLYSIARRYGSTVEKIKDLNGLKSNVISVDQRLKIQ